MGREVWHQKLEKEIRAVGQTPVDTNKKGLEGITQFRVEARFAKDECACCGMDYQASTFYQTSMMALSSEGKLPKLEDYHPNDVSSGAGAAGNKSKAQVSANRWVHEVDSDADMIND